VDASGAPRSAAEVRAFFERWIGASNRGEWDDVAAMMHDDVVLTDPMMAGVAAGKAAALERARAQYEPFPDGVVTMLGDPFVALDRPELAYRWRFTGTQLRAVDPPGFAPSGRRVTVDGTSVLGFRDGRVITVVLIFDTTTVARQLLAAPRAGGAMESVLALGQRLRVRADRLVPRRR
jgi:predicted ester cyclase